MTEKEKAEKLVNGYQDRFGFDTDTCAQCAIMAVNIILESVVKKPWSIAYWERVIEEIKKL